MTDAAPRQCPVHDGEIHGGEAEALRSGLEMLIESHVDVPRRLLQKLLDRVNARDSLAHLEREDLRGERDTALRACDDLRDERDAARRRRDEASQEVARLRELAVALRRECTDVTEELRRLREPTPEPGGSKIFVAVSDLGSTAFVQAMATAAKIEREHRSHHPPQRRLDDRIAQIALGIGMTITSRRDVDHASRLRHAINIAAAAMNMYADLRESIVAPRITCTAASASATSTPMPCGWTGSGSDLYLRADNRLCCPRCGNADVTCATPATEIASP